MLMSLQLPKLLTFPLLWSSFLDIQSAVKKKRKKKKNAYLDMDTQKDKRIGCQFTVVTPLNSYSAVAFLH